MRALGPPARVFMEKDMTKQIQDAYIVAAVRTPVGKAPRGMFKNVRPDDMLAHVLKGAIDKCRVSIRTTSAT